MSDLPDIPFVVVNLNLEAMATQMARNEDGIIFDRMSEDHQRKWLQLAARYLAAALSDILPATLELQSYTPPGLVFKRWENERYITEWQPRVSEDVQQKDVR